MSVKMLRRMGALRKRQHERLERTLSEQRKQLEQREAEVGEAQAFEEQKAQAERQACGERDLLTSQSFSPPALMAMDLHVQGCAQEVHQAAQLVAKAHKLVQQQAAAVTVCRVNVKRNEERMKTLSERLAKALRDREQLEEDTEAEEAEETAAARMAARRKPAAEGSRA
jgi:hypothetical protein